MRSEGKFQSALILLGVFSTILLAIFFYRELHPEYKIYQDAYVQLEEFRSGYTHKPPPIFSSGIKQIVLLSKTNGPPTIDRCVSCHVALEFPHFSPTKIAQDTNGHVLLDENGIPKQVPNEDYIWDKLDEKISLLTDNKVNQQLIEQGHHSEAQQRLKQANKLAGLKIAKVGEHEYDLTKALKMHPLIGKETRPFEFHSLDGSGCTSCHSGNGRGLVTDRAHGPLLDGEYEISFQGPKPHFLELDPKHDPRFSRMFNNKPGERLLFQTTPLLVGHLIEAKCVQCHLPTFYAGAKNTQAIGSLLTDIDLLTKSYQRGEELYFSQGCYACHRIAGFTRGGVGPELTEIGTTDPWYIKESIVWPQGDLKTSTMPNMKLDHEELELLMTFLLAQRTDRKAISSVDRQVFIDTWEKGKKMPWEQAIEPNKITNTRESMFVFATQGCASCHRLEGFDSNVGYRIEKDPSISFDVLYKEKEWFKSLFPEQILGSQIVASIIDRQDEIDQRISSDVRKNGILEEIERRQPESIEALYSEFKYAFREKNNESIEEQKQWKERVHRVLLMYIQEYGLGRLIGPRLNWSGIFRSNSWLMEHFWNPIGHSPRSIMPVFPFDDTKFLSLTYLLNFLAKQNQDHLRQLWDNRGFSPREVVQTLCTQCHGDLLHGNGPVSEWIYPIPKDLRNAIFLRNLTKEQAISSITHGVKGTPMPPWGEAIKDKEMQPVLKPEEIQQIVDWLFASLPEEKGRKGEYEVLKWEYKPQDFVKELEDEGGWIAASSPTIQDVFSSPEILNQNHYMIKKEFYTPSNIEEGEKFFFANCTVCHGKEADGSGVRASEMHDAKPRMFTNLDWLQTRDDHHLLRSIKYGVAGTAMTPWGDFTTAMQRMQLVMFIRSLNKTSEKNATLLQILYDVYEQMEDSIDKARAVEYAKLATVQQNYSKAKKERELLFSEAENKETSPQLLTDTYMKEALLLKELKKYQLQDHLYQEMIQKVKNEKKIYQEVGFTLLTEDSEDQMFNDYLKVILLNKNCLEYIVGQLIWNPPSVEKKNQLEQLVLSTIQDKIASLEKDEAIWEGKISSRERTWKLHEINQSIYGQRKLEQDLMNTFAEAAHLQQAQQSLLKELFR